MGSVRGVLDRGGYRQRGRGRFWVEFGASHNPVVTNAAFATRLFPNYFGQYLLYNSKYATLKVLTFQRLLGERLLSLDQPRSSPADEPSAFDSI